MLTYFPMPYPGEWWYSVLCRYHVRSGNIKQQTTIRELFPGRITAAISSIFPNSTIRQVIEQLPSDWLLPEAVITQNTLFPYYTRFFLAEKKTALLEKACLGETPTITSLRRSANLSKWRPRYCPQCAEEDRAIYGEAYWHIEHQIPFLKICPNHKCSLYVLEEIQPSHLGYTFYPLEAQVLCLDRCKDIPLWQRTVASILWEYETLPLKPAIAENHNHIAACLSNMGYGVIQNHSPNVILDAKRLYQDMADYYSPEVMEDIFGDVCIINRACKWGTASPERYALLQSFAGVSSETVFSDRPVSDHYADELKVLQCSGTHLTKKQVLEQLSVTPSQLNILLKKYHLEPFWRQMGGECAELGRHLFSFALNDEEFARFKQALRKSGYRYDSHFIRQCVMAYIDANQKEGSGDN